MVSLMGLPIKKGLYYIGVSRDNETENGTYYSILGSILGSP